MRFSKNSPITAVGNVDPAAGAAVGGRAKLLRTPNKTMIRDSIS